MEDEKHKRDDENLVKRADTGLDEETTVPRATEPFQKDSQDPSRLQNTFRSIGKTKEAEELDGNER